MNNILKSLAIAASFFSLVSSLVAQPNIIFIMADDLGYGDLGCYGQEKILTPNIDALAQQGMRFTQAYAGGPVCTASRSVLMTGLHNGHTPARDNVPHYDYYLEPEDITIAEVLKDAGYVTGGVGKWSLGDPGTVGDTTSQGFDMWFGYQNQDHAHFYFPEYLDDSEAPSGRVNYPGNSRTRRLYSHDALTGRALKFITENAGQPFFLYAAYTVPHFSNKLEDEDRLAVPDLGPYEDRDWTLAAKKYASMVSRLDYDVGRIVQMIDSVGLSENTLIIFTSDQGPLGSGPYEELNSNGSLRGSKRTLYEGGIRIPFIARWKGTISENNQSDQVITFWDMLPTLAEVAGYPVFTGVDGHSVWPAFLGNRIPESHEYLYWDYGHNRKRYDQAVRLGDWKAVRHGETGPLQLFNLNNDLGEADDVSAEHPEVVKEITRIMDTAVDPSDRYEIGELYTGKPIWNPTWLE
jgi:arylsulfatase A-like enzyme